MLPEKDVMEAIRTDALKISYYFYPQARPPDALGEEFVDDSNPERPARKAFREAFFGDRLQLTLGPLVLSHNYGLLPGRRRYKGMAGVFDLRESGKITLRPRESITVNTIERIAVDGSLGALVLPRLTLATAGLVLTPSYIDPWWDGVLVLHMSNQSGRKVELRFGEAIAACRFYEIDGDPLPPEFKDRFAEKSHHYGLAWGRILTSDSDPFPLRKRPAPTLLQRDRGGLIDHLKHYGRTLAAFGVTAAVVVGATFWIGNTQGRVNQVDQVYSKQQELAERLTRLEAKSRPQHPLRVQAEK